VDPHVATPSPSSGVGDRETDSFSVGDAVGFRDGDTVGFRDGDAVGLRVGLELGGTETDFVGI